MMENTYLARHAQVMEAYRTASDLGAGVIFAKLVAQAMQGVLL
jgi:hypothetical protein